ncbi:unnamed protein product [Caenorhabditis bovis]|uniref:glucuronosyltransferase n=1 Tax=Caenorhabditis bovis TaxID=2654633 RepID=A0A8S1E7K7_9PELO|nr:unnamed protein product [Caenorhabditis bovis]
MSKVQIFELLEVLDNLKHLKRTGWVKCGVPEPETVACHMYRMAILALSLEGQIEGLDTIRALKMALVHDIGEAIAGDITPHCGVSDQEKFDMESKAIRTICSFVPNVGDEWDSLWREYEAAETLTAKVVKHLDKFDMIAQADKYERVHGIDLEQFFTSTVGVLKMEPFASWDKQLREKRESRLTNHANFLAKIADTLTEAGHNVTYFSPIIYEGLADVDFVKLTKDVIRIFPNRVGEKPKQEVSLNTFRNSWVEDTSSFEAIQKLEGMLIESIPYFQKFYDHYGDLMAELKSRKYDAIIFEIFMFEGFYLRDTLNIPVAIPCTSVTHEFTALKAIGEPAMPSVLATTMGYWSDEMDFFTRIKNFATIQYAQWILQLPKSRRSLSNPDRIISLTEEFRKFPFLLTNANPYLDFQRPTITKTVQIGGIAVDVNQIKSAKLAEEYDVIMKLRRRTVLVSFGSAFMSCDMPNEYKKTLADAMKSFKDTTFIWKYEKDDTSFASDAENIVFKKWVPQTQLLADPRLTVFVSHGGLGSITELAYLGKPALLVPIFGDQMRNAAMISRHGCSILISKFDLSNFDKVHESLSKLLTDEKYKNNADKLADILNSAPIPPREMLIKHVEFATKFKEIPALEPHYHDMSNISYFMIDIGLFLLITLHANFLAIIADTLMETGHNVTYFSPIMDERLADVDFVKLTNDVIRIFPNRVGEKPKQEVSLNTFRNSWVDEASIIDTILKIRGILDECITFFDKICNNYRDLIDELRARKYDAIIFEMVIFEGFYLRDTLNIPMAIPCASVTHEILLSKAMGEPVMPSILATGDSQKIVVQSGYDCRSRGDADFLHRFVIYTFKEEQRKFPFLLTNANPYLDFQRPTITKTVQIGGIAVDVNHIKSLELPNKYNRILELRQRTVLVSFGSAFFSSDMPELSRKTLVKVMRSFKDKTFIWKYETNDTAFAIGATNIIFEKWVPQAQLLADPRLTVFVSHGGLGSITELAYLGKPALLVPIFGDQMRNAAMISRHGCSILISKFDLSNFDKVHESLSKLLTDEIYKNNADKLADILNSAPIPPREMLIKHVEFATRFKEIPALDPHYHDMPSISYLMLDVLAFCIFSSIVFILVIMSEEVAKFGDLATSSDFSKFWTSDADLIDTIDMHFFFKRMFTKTIDNLFEDHRDKLDELKAEKYDAFIFEAIIISALQVKDYLNITTTLPMLSMTHNARISMAYGQPAMLSTLSEITAGLGDEMSFTERVHNLLLNFAFCLFFPLRKIPSVDDPNRFIDIKEELIKSPFFFTNSNPYLDYQHPVITKTVQIGGISANHPHETIEKIGDEFDSLLNLREKTVLISFGTVILASTMPANLKTNIIQAIKQFPNVTFIWKYEGVDKKFAEIAPNAHLFNWIPQTALLADPRLSLFVTHGGLGSVTELSYSGKPAILIPIFSDQMRNSKMLKRHGGALQLTKFDLASPSKLENALREILYNPKYQENAEILAEQLKSQPIKPADLLVKHVEFGTRFGELKSLQPHFLSMPFYQYFMLDTIGLGILLIFVSFRLLKIIMRPFKTKLKVL